MTKEERKIYNRDYYKNNKKELLLQQKRYDLIHQEEILKMKKEYYQENKETILAKRKEFYENNKATILERQKKVVRRLLKNNINYKLAKNIRCRLYQAIKNNFKAGSSIKDLGCSIPELKTYLESKFQDGMTWNNWSPTGWHIDHVQPLDFFDLQNRDEFLKVCHYTNLQPMWAEENLKKANKIKEI